MEDLAVKLSEKVQKWWSLGGVIICHEMEKGGREGGMKSGEGGREGRRIGGREGRREGGKEERREGRRIGGREGRRREAITHMHGSLNSRLFQELLQYLPLCTHVI